ncbi:hypothetical protein [Flavobacterium collinsii]|jgi:hypothetical protein|uniref:Bacteriocin-type signal sequence n=1 Tax=Flavobacterium collinsii TaxID=1114861 RepID=A0ABM8KJM7_9FLAO|nr:hypothetical protein [Flavobacterium collinsii]CAA9199286.1 hypothetical protein FLACOL7796_02653 [Flavobacterium collinsii]
MTNKEAKDLRLEKTTNLKSLSKNQLETIVGGPETSRGTHTKVGD